MAERCEGLPNSSPGPSRPERVMNRTSLQGGLLAPWRRSRRISESRDTDGATAIKVREPACGDLPRGAAVCRTRKRPFRKTPTHPAINSGSSIGRAGSRMSL